MDLLRLHLQNFTSYPDETIDLQGIHVAGLLGPNGSGKSSLIDSILWALYGESPKGGKRDADNFVRTGTDECSVIVDFTIGRHIYRVVRSWNRKERKGKLGFFVYEEDWVPRGKNAKEAQAEIERVLRMDYKTFVATVIQVQDKATQSFTDCSDADRKAILASILGLDTWDKVAKITADKIKLLSAEKAKVERSVEYYQQLADTYDDAVAELRRANIRLRSLEMQLKEVNEAMKAAQSDVDRDIDLDNEYMDLLAKRSKLEFDNNVKLKQISDRISTKQAQLSDLVKKRTEQEKKITEIKSILESTEQAVADFEEYEKLKVEAESLKDKFEEYLVRTTELEREERELKSLEELFAEVSKSASLVSQVGCDEENKKRCPLIRVAWENYNRLDLLSASIVECQEKISALKSQVEQLQPMYDRVEQCSSLSVSLSYSVDAIARRSKALDDKKHIEELIDEYNKSIALYTTELEELTKEQKDASTCYESELAAIDARLEEISELTKPLIDQEYILKQLEEESEQLQSQIEELRYEVGGIRAKVTSAENAREELNIYYGELVDIEEKIALYKVIEKAASKKNGVPSLIVENAIPEIEAIANDLLDRVSDGRFSVHFETQKESKTTDSIQEVLKITVMDDGEPRAFQTYSGAQRFMLDFSIRVAISKFLAHRSGTEIKLLVIDEGFSALDNANFAKVVEVINEIAQDFEKVLIITHIDKLKTLLPQRINFSLVGKWTKVTIQGE